MERESSPQKRGKRGKIPLMRSASGSIHASTGRNADVSQQYMAEAEKYPLLTKEDEITYGKEIQIGLKAETLLADLTPEEQAKDAEYVNDLKKRIKVGEAAQEAMVCSNLRLVVFVARRFSIFPDIMDAIQAGNMGLVRAVRSFDPCNGTKFSTYAVWWIRQSIFKQESKELYAVRLPDYTHDIRRKMAYIENQAAMNNKTATDKEIAAQVGCTEKTVEAIRAVSQCPIYLNQRTSDDGDPLLEWLTQDSSVCDVEDEVWQEQMSQILAGILNRFLTEREQYVIKRRFGVCGEPGSCTLEEISQSMGITRERVRQIEKKALEKLKICSGTKHLKQLLQNMCS